MMEFQLSKQPVGISEVLYDAVTEQPIECDVLLPDYCPDIQKILHCEVMPALLTHTVSGDQLSVDGIAIVHLYYLDESGCLRHAEYKIPYTKTITLRAAPQSPSVMVSQNVDYFNCRSVSQRRLDMRGAVSISARVTGQTEEQIVSGAQGMGVELRTELVEHISELPEAMQQMSVREEVELGYGKPAIGNVIRCSAVARVTDYKVLSGKIVTKGEAAVKLLYECEEDPKKLEVMEYSLPISQVLDLSGVEEECPCSIWYDVCSAEAVTKRSADGENRLISLDLSMNACARACKKVSFEAACDCYSTQYECKQTQKQVVFSQLADLVAEACPFKEVIALPADAKNMIDLWCTVGAVTTRQEADCVTVSGKLIVCMLLYSGADEILYNEQTKEFNQKIPMKEPCETPVFLPQVSADHATYTMSGADKLEVRCTLQIRGGLYDQQRKQVLCDLSVDEAHPKTRRENVLYLYYAQEQEPIWDIAKRYNTSVTAIQQGNQITDTTAGGKTLLLIPMK